jgi:hypothetical protein
MKLNGDYPISIKTKTKTVRIPTGTQMSRDGVEVIYRKEKQAQPIIKKQLKAQTMENLKVKLNKEIESIKNHAKGKGLLAQRQALEQIKKLETEFNKKYKYTEPRESARKIRQANIIIEKLEKLSSEYAVTPLKRYITSDTPLNNGVAADYIIKKYVNYMKKNKLDYRTLSKKDAGEIIVETISDMLNLKKNKLDYKTLP